MHTLARTGENGWGLGLHIPPTTSPSVRFENVTHSLSRNMNDVPTYVVSFSGNCLCRCAHVLATFSDGLGKAACEKSLCKVKEHLLYHRKL